MNRSMNSMSTVQVTTIDAPSKALRDTTLALTLAVTLAASFWGASSAHAQDASTGKTREAPLDATQQFQLTPTDRELPAFELLHLSDGTWDQFSLEGIPYIVNFWATWCAPCVHELPAMNRAYERLEDEGVGMVAINVGEPAGAIKTFMQTVPIDFNVLLGSQMTLPNWKVRGLPTTFIVSADGKIIAEAIGPREWDNPAFIDYMLALRDPGS